MNKTLRPLAALALIVMVALISGCGSSTPAQTSSSTGTGSSTGSASSSRIAVMNSDQMTKGMRNIYIPLVRMLMIVRV